MLTLDLNGKQRTGGRLLAGVDPSLVGPQDCLLKQNCRTHLGREELVEGWDLLEKSLSRLAHPITRISHVTRPNGETALIFASQSTIYRWDESGRALRSIGSGYSMEGLRWQTVELNGFLVFNNGVDLPFCYRVEWDSVRPLYELREQGVARAGAMWAFGGCLWLGDIWEFKAEKIDEWWENPGSELSSHDQQFSFYAAPAQRNAYDRDIPDDFLQRVPYRRIWSDANDPQSWRLVLPASVVEGQSKITLARPTQSLQPGDTVRYVERIDSESDGVSLVFETQILQVGEDEKTLVIDHAPALSSATGYVVRSDYAAQLSGYDDQMVDGDTILRGWPVAGKLILAYDRGFLLVKATGNSAQPFITQPLYAGPESLAVPELSYVIDDRLLVYRTHEAWRSFNLSDQLPKPIQALEQNEPLFSGCTPSSGAFCQWNPRHQELWIVLPEDDPSAAHYGQVAVWQPLEDNVFTISSPVRGLSAVGAFPQMVPNAADQHRWFVASHDGKIYESHETQFHYAAGKPVKASLIFGPVGSEGHTVSILEHTHLANNAHRQVRLASQGYPGEPGKELATASFERAEHRKWRTSFFRAPYLALTISFWPADPASPKQPSLVRHGIKAVASTATTIQF